MKKLLITAMMLVVACTMASAGESVNGLGADLRVQKSWDIGRHPNIPGLYPDVDEYPYVSEYDVDEYPYVIEYPYVGEYPDVPYPFFDSPYFADEYPYVVGYPGNT